MIAAEPGSGSTIQDHSGSSELELFSTENFDGSGATSSFQSEIRIVFLISFLTFCAQRGRKLLRFIANVCKNAEHDKKRGSETLLDTRCCS